MLELAGPLKIDWTPRPIEEVDPIARKIMPKCFDYKPDAWMETPAGKQYLACTNENTKRSFESTRLGIKPFFQECEANFSPSPWVANPNSAQCFEREYAREEMLAAVWKYGSAASAALGLALTIALIHRSFIWWNERKIAERRRVEEKIRRWL